MRVSESEGCMSLMCDSIDVCGEGGGGREEEEGGRRRKERIQN